MTISQAHRKIAQLLTDGGYARQEAHATARILLDAIAGAPHAHLTKAHDSLTAAQEVRLQAALTELKAGRPLAYILGQREFYGLQFQCDERALIPRPETELLVDFALAQLQQRALVGLPRALQVADLGTGTGCVAISIAVHFPGARVVATDISPTTLELARANARLHKVDERLSFVTGQAGNWAAPFLPQQKAGFDVIVSNPPYITPHDIAALPVQIKDFEPLHALDGGQDGLDCYRQIARQCRVLLTPGGILACELGVGQFDSVQTIFETHGWTVEKPILDFQDIARVIVART